MLTDLEWAPREERYLVGVSGGADSVALLHGLVQARYSNLVVCHLNHQLRGLASEKDAEFVKQLAGDLNLPCVVGAMDVRLRMCHKRESLETAARHARHEFFANCATRFQTHRLFLAHHADDQAETALWNLLRGSYGLKAMQALQSLSVSIGGTEIELELYRPLLPLRHEELVLWLMSKHLLWREDDSNSEAIAIRNRLRNEVFPLLNEIAGRDAVRAMTRAVAVDAELTSFRDDVLAQYQIEDPQGRLHLRTLREMHTVLQTEAIRRYLLKYGISSVDRSLLDAAIKLMDINSPAAMNLPGGRRLRRTEGRLWVD